MSEAYKLYVCIQCGFEYDEAKAGRRTVSPRVPGGTTSPKTGAARTAARRSPTSTWWRSPLTGASEATGRVISCERSDGRECRDRRMGGKSR